MSAPIPEPTELRYLGELIGITYRGRRVDLLDVSPQRGTALIVDRGHAFEIPVSALRWHTPTEGSN